MKRRICINMGKNNNQLKMLANLAKQRLLNKEYQNPEPKSIFNKNASSYFLKNAKALKKLTAQTEFLVISDKEDEKFIKKVHSILDSQECVFNVLSKLIDKDYYKTLNEIEKQQYMHNVSDRYNKVREEYYKSVV